MPAAWGFFAPLAIDRSAGVCIGILWLSHEVVRPIEMLAKIGTDNAPGAPRCSNRLRLALCGVGQSGADAAVSAREFWTSGAARRTNWRRVSTGGWRKRPARSTQNAAADPARDWRDPLTGLYNRRMLEGKRREAAGGAAPRRRRLQHVMFDVDHFKTLLNDTLGHMAGDEMLQFVGAACSSKPCGERTSRCGNGGR